jgi:hypothetical protein
MKTLVIYLLIAMARGIFILLEDSESRGTYHNTQVRNDISDCINNIEKDRGNTK